jgi:hypothetical protein
LLISHFPSKHSQSTSWHAVNYIQRAEGEGAFFAPSRPPLFISLIPGRSFLYALFAHSQPLHHGHRHHRQKKFRRIEIRSNYINTLSRTHTGHLYFSFCFKLYKFKLKEEEEDDFSRLLDFYSKRCV